MLKKTVHRPNHRERAQPREREKWGILEKHKDYSLRARDYSEKKKRLKILRQKAAERNPDEFRHAMLNSRSKQGRRITDRGNTALSQEAVKLLKTQDSGYLRTIIQKTRKDIEKLEKEFVLREGQSVEVIGGREDHAQGQHVVFVDNTEQQKQHLLATDKHTNKIPLPYGEDEGSDNDEVGILESSPLKVSRSSRGSFHEAVASVEERTLKKRHKKGHDTRKAKLIALRTREKDLIDAENELELQRAKMTGSVGGVTKAGLKWQSRERRK